MRNPADVNVQCTTDLQYFFYVIITYYHIKNEHVFLSYQINSTHRSPPISTPFRKRKLRTGGKTDRFKTGRFGRLLSRGDERDICEFLTNRKVTV